ncbi:omptin family outer membrane protease [Chitinophaga sp. CB10]|uniref:omptin family outer membrane protease n=1 Tax=Chitinophaga sp. CB10 TaxID=1891659 RepID=UPI0025BAE679|nr:omptin family outer membrane protease [Chitinophaga sp. CB10]
MKLFIAISLLCLYAVRTIAQVEATFSGGYEAAALSWSIGGKTNNEPINVLSELKWRGLRGPLWQGGLKWHPRKRWYIAGEMSKSRITAGHAEDTDYGANDRRSPTYHARLDSDEGALSSCRLFGGFHFLQREKLDLGGFAGYVQRREELLLLNHAAAQPGQKNLRSTYNTRWSGVTGGVAGAYHFSKRLHIAAELQYSQLRFHAAADWNLVDAFQHPVSFRQQANGFDLGASLKVALQLNHHLSLFLSGMYRHAATGTGSDELYLANGAVQTARFNGAYAHACKALTGGSWAF